MLSFIRYINTCRYILTMKHHPVSFDKFFYISEKEHKRTETLIPLGVKNMKELKDILFSITFYKDKDELNF